MIISVQYLRALASILVVIVHAFELHRIYFKKSIGISEKIYMFGGIGVDIFFVISGFIMMYICSKKPLVSFSQFLKFFENRVIRIAPLYLLITFFLALSLFIFPSLFNRTKFDFIHLIYSIFFIPYFNSAETWHPILAQGWTLTYEFLFYLLMGISCWLFGKRGVYVCAFFLLINYFFNASLDYSTSLERIFFEPRLIQFSFGIFLGALFLSNKILAGVLPNLLVSFLCIILVMYWVINFELVDDIQRAFLWGVISFLICYFLISNENFLNKFKSNFFLSLGDSSYSLYLTHNIVLAVAFKLLVFSKVHLSFYFVIPLVISLCLFVGHYTYTFIERPITLLFKKKA